MRSESFTAPFLTPEVMPVMSGRYVIHGSNLFKNILTARTYPLKKCIQESLGQEKIASGLCRNDEEKTVTLYFRK
jgi:hypothetical protein